jgi:hypothetical protein
MALILNSLLGETFLLPACNSSFYANIDAPISQYESKGDFSSSFLYAIVNLVELLISLIMLFGSCLSPRINFLWLMRRDNLKKET